jgi:hypothetical protein
MYRRQNIIMRIDIPQLLSVLLMYLFSSVLFPNYDKHPAVLGPGQEQHPPILYPLRPLPYGYEPLHYDHSAMLESEQVQHLFLSSLMLLPHPYEPLHPDPVMLGLEQVPHPLPL